MEDDWGARHSGFGDSRLFRPSPHPPHIDAFETFCHDAGAGLGKGAIPMRGDTSRLPLALAALVGGLALFVAGFIIAAEVRSADAGAAATGGACYTNWNADTCAAGYTAVSTGVWTLVGPLAAYESTALICAEAKTEVEPYGFQPISDTSKEATVRGHLVQDEPCAVCCAGGATVGGIGELPPVAGMGGSSGYNYAIAAVLAVVAVVAFAAGGWYARRRWTG